MTDHNDLPPKRTRSRGYDVGLEDLESRLRRCLREASSALAPIVSLAGEARLAALRGVLRALNTAAYHADELLHRAEYDLRAAQTAKMRGPIRIEGEIDGSHVDAPARRRSDRGPR